MKKEDKVENENLDGDAIENEAEGKPLNVHLLTYSSLEKLLKDKQDPDSDPKCPGCFRACRSNFFLVHYACRNLIRSEDSLSTPQHLCPKCGTAFRHHTSYIRHMRGCGKPKSRVPLGKPPWICKSCGRIYKNYNSFSRHRGECGVPPPHECSRCHMKFREKNKLFKHNLKDHFTCTVCNMQFSMKRKLDYHVAHEHLIL
uniref:C2H2-type domain-containing protein n=1 Tax=Homalodisca liturata TaxID=320908 RepID=A0A1B6IM51_9HEMI